MSKRRAWMGLMVAGTIGLVLSLQTRTIAADAPQTVVTQFYQWYVKDQDRLRERISQQRDSFDPALYQQLTQAFQKQPSDGQFLDFDPFSGTQVSSYKATVRNVQKTSNTKADVNIDVYAGLRSPGKPVPIRVVVVQQNDRWRINNLVYKEPEFDLLTQLKTINGSK